MGRTRGYVLLSVFLGSLLLLIALGCGGNSNNTKMASPGAPGMNGGGSGGGASNGSGGSGNGSGNSNGGGGSASNSASKFIFGGVGFENGMVDAGMINSNGSVSPVPGSPFDEGLGQSNTFEMIADPQGRFFYVLNGAASAAGMPLGQSGIAEFAINQSTGALATVPGSPFLFSQADSSVMVADNTGRFLLQPNGSGNIASTGFDIYSIDQSSGALTKTSSTSNAPPVGQFSVASPSSPLIFNAGNGLVAAFSVNPSNGQLTIVTGTPASTGGSAGPMAITSDGKFLFVANQQQGNVAAFSISSTGTLTPVTGSPFTTNSMIAQRLALTPDAKFLYIASTPQNSSNQVPTVNGYAVNLSAGTLTPISGAVVANANTVNVDHSGKFAYISSPRNLVTYSIDPNTGALMQVAQTTAPASDDPYDMVTVP
jgi:6-phosphogluconolactonase (cycloisomerase 2 family)